jgi:hypothetical protein
MGDVTSGLSFIPSHEIKQQKQPERRVWRDMPSRIYPSGGSSSRTMCRFITNAMQRVTRSWPARIQTYRMPTCSATRWVFLRKGSQDNAAKCRQTTVSLRIRQPTLNSKPHGPRDKPLIDENPKFSSQHCKLSEHIDHTWINRSLTHLNSMNNPLRPFPSFLSGATALYDP